MDGQGSGSQTALEERISASANEFDLPALLAVLVRSGFSFRDIQLRSNPSALFHASLIERVEFVTVDVSASSPGRRCALVSLNLGLTSSQSPLPSYFRQLGEQEDYELQLADLLFFLDHPLLAECAASQFPERDPRLFPDWQGTRRDLLRLLALSAPRTLHWLFRQVFPELGVGVCRLTMKTWLPVPGICLGHATLGQSSAFGGLAPLEVGGIRVTLHCEGPTDWTGTPWGVEAPRRLKTRIAPLLVDVDLFLEVYLRLLEAPRPLQLGGTSSLGYDVLEEGQGGERLVLLYRGPAASLGG